MKPIRIFGLSLLLALAAPAAFAQNLCGAPCRQMLDKGLVLEAQDKYQEALDTYRAAQKAEPLASSPFAMEAGLLFNLSTRVKPELSREWRDGARAQAERALKLWSDDPVAQEVLRRLDDDAPEPLHVPNAQAERLYAEAETQFGQQHYEQALQKYRAATQADPQFSIAWVDAGDCYFRQKDWTHAEALFRRATEIEPRNSRAWRYLADALIQQDKRDAAEAALLSAIAADPSQRPNWSKLAAMREADGQPLQSLALRRGVQVAPGADGKYAVGISDLDNSDLDNPDFGVRLMLGAVEARLRNEDKAAGTSRSAYAIELKAWREALGMVDEVSAKSGSPLSDPAFVRMRALAREGQLEPAILLLTFRHAYRPDLEAWLAAHPGGVKAFVDRVRLQP
jgi:tetratricopeptide (TPR) repeat protein